MPAGASTAYSTTRLALAVAFSLMNPQRVSPGRPHTAGRCGQLKNETRDT
jgi:hypothetical protein